MTPARRTVAGSATVKGIGLHSGKRTTVTLRAGEPGRGVVFRRTDVADQEEIPATIDHVSDGDRATSLANGTSEVRTVEHLLAAVAAHGVDDLLVELKGSEIPIGDGSAQPFFDAIAKAGVSETPGTPKIYRVRAPFVVKEGEATYTVSPAESLRLTVTVEWEHASIGRQSGCYDIDRDSFATSLAGARTFGFQAEAEDLRSRGLIKGVSEANTIVLTETGIIGDLRWPDEFVRHKAVDLLGDLTLLGGRVRADIVAFRPSHRGNIALARAIARSAQLDGPAVMGIEQILGVIPHRYPMLLVDRIVEIEPGKRIVGIKNVTINEPFFQGHFPGHPIMPGVLIVEAMAQVGGMLFMGAFDDPSNKVVYFLSIDNVKFRRPVTPGDQLRFELEMQHLRGRNCRMHGIGYVDGQPVAEADMMARVVDT